MYMTCSTDYYMPPAWKTVFVFWFLCGPETDQKSCSLGWWIHWCLGSHPELRGCLVWCKQSEGAKGQSQSWCSSGAAACSTGCWASGRPAASEFCAAGAARGPGSRSRCLGIGCPTKAQPSDATAYSDLTASCTDCRSHSVCTTGVCIPDSCHCRCPSRSCQCGTFSLGTFSLGGASCQCGGESGVADPVSWGRGFECAGRHEGWDCRWCPAQLGEQHRTSWWCKCGWAWFRFRWFEFCADITFYVILLCSLLVAL